MFSTEKVTRAIMLSMDNFGSWLVETLGVMEITQSDLARMSGLSRGTISNIISGSRGRGPDSLQAIAKALKLPPEQVFRAAGILPVAPDEDPWIKEQEHKLRMISPKNRGIAGDYFPEHGKLSLTVSVVTLLSY